MHLGMLSNLSVTMTGLERGLLDGKLSSRALLSIQLKPLEQKVVRQDDKMLMNLSSQYQPYYNINSVGKSRRLELHLVHKTQHKPLSQLVQCPVPKHSFINPNPLIHTLPENVLFS